MYRENAWHIRLGLQHDMAGKGHALRLALPAPPRGRCDERTLDTTVRQRAPSTSLLYVTGLRRLTSVDYSWCNKYSMTIIRSAVGQTSSELAMNILRVVGDINPATGGPTTVHAAAVVSLRAAGANIECLTLDAGVADVSNFPDYRAMSNRDIRIHVFSRVFDACRFVYGARKRFDVVHVDGCWWRINFLPVLIAKSVGIPAFVSPHESFTGRDMGQSKSRVRKAGKRLLSIFYQRFADAVVYSSQLELHDSLRHRNALVIAHPVFDDTAGAVAAPVRDGRVAKDVLHLGYLGRYHPKKRLEDIITASVSTVDARLIIAGSGPQDYEASLRALAGRDPAKVAWLGFLQDAQREEFFRNIDFLVLASDYECFGMAAAEALVRGIPVIVTERVGVAAEVKSGGGGYVIEEGVSSLRDIFARCLALTPGEYERLQKGALAAAAPYSYLAHGRAQIAAYCRVRPGLARHSRAASPNETRIGSQAAN